MQPLTIIADSETHGIYINEACKPNDFKCVIGNEILVWNSSVLHECPFEIINIARDLEYKENKYFISKTDNLLFELSNIILNCGIDMYEANEGIYLSNSSDIVVLAKKGVKNNRDNHFIINLLVANIDFNEYHELKWLKRIDQKLCKLYKSQISMLLNTEGK